MATQKSPAFSFYAKDFLTGTVTMSLVERGAYVTLLAYQWDSGFVPADDAARARLLGCTAAQAAKVWAVVAEKFTKQGSGFVNTRLEQERIKQAERRQKLAVNGSKGGANTQAKNKQLLEQQLEQNSSPPSSSSFPVSANTKTPKPPQAGAEKILVRVRREAKAVRKGWGMCAHQPVTCMSEAACIERIAADLVAKAKAS